MFGTDSKSLPEAIARRYYSTNEQARDAFIARKNSGLGLSDNVWRYTDQFKTEIELALDVGIRNGRSSAYEIARDLREYLKYPDRLFRRVRDEHGLLHLSKKAKLVNPGKGVYRSSYLNTRRLAATETNIAYRTADYLRWQQLDFVVGIKVLLSNNHTVKLQPGETTDDPTQLQKDGTPKANAVRPLTDMCDDLQGRYPKDFKFTGWHPHCRCHAVTILKTEEEMAEDTKRILAGEKPLSGSVNEVTDVPEGFAKWIGKNSKRIDDARKNGTLPYFIRDNQQRVTKILEDRKGVNRLDTNKIKIGDKEWTIREIITECKIVETENGKVYLHPNHGKNEVSENLEFAKWRAEHFNEEIVLLPNLQNVKSADSYNITRRVIEEYKKGKTPTQNAIDRLLRDGVKQAKYIILEIDCNAASSVVSNALNDRDKRCNIKGIRIKIGKAEAVYSRNVIIQDRFNIKPEDFHIMTVSRSRGSTLKKGRTKYRCRYQCKIKEIL